MDDRQPEGAVAVDAREVLAEPVPERQHEIRDAPRVGGDGLGLVNPAELPPRAPLVFERVGVEEGVERRVVCGVSVGVVSGGHRSVRLLGERPRLVADGLGHVPPDHLVDDLVEAAGLGDLHLDPADAVVLL